MVSTGDKAILEYKKVLFLENVEKASNSLNVITPKVKFWDGRGKHFDKGERAHIHLGENLICISEPELKIMDEEEIIETATHEVSHIHNSGHGGEFLETHKDLKISSWQPPSGTVGALPEGYKSPKETKERKERPIKYKCNYCGRKGKTKKCKYCGGYYCTEHLKPTEPYYGMIAKSKYRVDEKNTHPCPQYSAVLRKKEKKEKEKYGKALDRLLKRKSVNVPRVEKSNENISPIGREALRGKTLKFLDKKQFKNMGDPSKNIEKNIKRLSLGKSSRSKKKSYKFYMILFWFVVLAGLFYFSGGEEKVRDYLAGNPFFGGLLPSSAESRVLSSEVFDKINEARNNNPLDFDRGAYNLAVSISKQFFNSGIYDLNGGLSERAKSYNLGGVDFLSRKLDSLEESQFDIMGAEWITKKIFSEKALSTDFNRGAVGCYKEFCIFVLSFKLIPTKTVVIDKSVPSEENQEETPPTNAEEEQVEEQKTPEELLKESCLTEFTDYGIYNIQNTAYVNNIGEATTWFNANYISAGLTEEQRQFNIDRKVSEANNFVYPIVIINGGFQEQPQVVSHGERYCNEAGIIA